MSDAVLSVPPHADGAAALLREKIGNPLVRQSIDYWLALCGPHRFPARDALTLRGMAPFLQLTVIVAVIDGGADYEYRYVGEAQRQAFRTYFKGMRVSQIEAASPELGALLRGVYDQVRSTGTPKLLQGRVDQEFVGTGFRYHETILLPLGAGDAVDHMLAVGVQVPTPFWEFSDEKLKSLADQISPRPV